MIGCLSFDGLFYTVGGTKRVCDVEVGETLYHADSGEPVKVSKILRRVEEVCVLTLRVPDMSNSKGFCRSYSTYRVSVGMSGQLLMRSGDSVGIGSLLKMRRMFLNGNRLFLPVSYTPQCNDVTEPELWAEVVGMVSLVDRRKLVDVSAMKDALSHQVTAVQVAGNSKTHCLALHLEPCELNQIAESIREIVQRSEMAPSSTQNGDGGVCADETYVEIGEYSVGTLLDSIGNSNSKEMTPYLHFLTGYWEDSGENLGFQHDDEVNWFR